MMMMMMMMMMPYLLDETLPALISVKLDNMDPAFI